ncbi:RING finger protein 227 [Genypterus blacodes]|uniref:RING finger protein 227 n=1 Tax=Genypterus blacodes TaxID=154954 RepID=UPI003F75C8D7
MYSELECGICYQMYNTGRRCPRELQCKHSFCESCLLALSQPQGAEQPDRLIICPLCRQVTSISGEERIKAALRVDECVLELMVAADVLNEEGDPVEEGGEDEDQVHGDCDDQAIPHESPAEEEHSPPGSRRRRLRRSLRRVWRKISGQDAQQSGGEMCMTNDDFRIIAMMASNMF